MRPVEYTIFVAGMTLNSMPMMSFFVMYFESLGKTASNRGRQATDFWKPGPSKE